MDKNAPPCPHVGNGEVGDDARSCKNPETLEHQVLPSISIAEQNTMGIRKNYKMTANRGKKGSQVTDTGYTLRSSGNNAVLLGSISNSKTSTEPGETKVQAAPKRQVQAQPAANRRKRGRPAKGRPSNERQTDEFSQIRKRVRYVLNRMNYEQSLIEAYASEGWKNQSLDKIRPEKELERAKNEILRCKLRIREIFQNLDSLLSQGKIDESLFDSEGEISCEDIFCAICGLKDVKLGNDIILCDGACDRGFHQNCLNPPLPTEDIPVGDEGWLCPACDCKIDCIDIINELQGSDLSIGDSWEKVFPEAAAWANGSKQDDTFDLPSDDSEDDDFDPTVAEEHVTSKDEGPSEEDEDGDSDSDDSNFVTSDDSEPLMDKKVDDLGMPSEDSEDDDFDPADPDSDKDPQKKSSSDESDFTSDSDDFCAEIAKKGGNDEVSRAPLPDVKAEDTTNDVEKITAEGNITNPDLNSMEAEMDQNVVLPLSGRRHVERLDYKKLYDEAYGTALSDSSDDEEWSGKRTPEKADGKHEVDSSADQRHGGNVTSNGSNSTARKGQFDPIVNQRLREHFQTEQYPTRAVKESLAEELGLTSRQVGRWFETRRRFTRAASAKKGVHQDSHSAGKTNSPVVSDMQLNVPEEMVMGKSNVCTNDVMNEMVPGNLNEGCNQGSARKEVVHVHAIQGGSAEKNDKDAPLSDLRGSQGDCTEDPIPGLYIDEARKKAIQREMKKRKTGR